MNIARSERTSRLFAVKRKAQSEEVERVRHRLGRVDFWSQQPDLTRDLSISSPSICEIESASAALSPRMIRRVTRLIALFQASLFEVGWEARSLLETDRREAIGQ